MLALMLPCRWPLQAAAAAQGGVGGVYQALSTHLEHLEHGVPSHSSISMAVPALLPAAHMNSFIVWCFAAHMPVHLPRRVQRLTHHHPSATTQAFAALITRLGYTDPRQLLFNTQLLTSVLNYHIIPNTILANTTALAAAGTLTTRLTGKSLTAGGSASAPTVQGETNTANVVTSSTITGPYGSGMTVSRPQLSQAAAYTSLASDQRPCTVDTCISSNVRAPATASHQQPCAAAEAPASKQARRQVI